MPKKFHVGVKAVITRSKKALVLTEKDIEGGKALIYDLPGGRIENRELAEDALKRELKEELGIKNYSVGKLLKASVHPNYNKQGVGLMLLFYEVKIEKLNLKLGKEHENYQWISIKDLEKLVKNKNKIHKGIVDAFRKAL